MGAGHLLVIGVGRVVEFEDRVDDRFDVVHHHRLQHVFEHRSAADVNAMQTGTLEHQGLGRGIHRLARKHADQCDLAAITDRLLCFKLRFARRSSNFQYRRAKYGFYENRAGLCGIDCGTLGRNAWHY